MAESRRFFFLRTRYMEEVHILKHKPRNAASKGDPPLVSLLKFTNDPNSVFTTNSDYGPASVIQANL